MSKKESIEQLFFYSSLVLLSVAAVFLFEGKGNQAENAGNLIFILFSLLVAKKIVNYIKGSDD